MFVCFVCDLRCDMLCGLCVCVFVCECFLLFNVLVGFVRDVLCGVVWLSFCVYCRCVRFFLNKVVSVRVACEV